VRGTKVIIWGEKIEKDFARLGFELTTMALEGEYANHYTTRSPPPLG